MLTIERNNPHKKISVGVLSLALGFASTYGLLSATMSGNDATASANPPQPNPVVATNASSTKERVQQTPGQEQSDQNVQSAAPETRDSEVQDSYVVPAAPNTAISQEQITPNENQSPLDEHVPVEENPSLIDQVMSTAESAVKTVVPIL